MCYFFLNVVFLKEMEIFTDKTVNLLQKYLFSYISKFSIKLVKREKEGSRCLLMPSLDPGNICILPRIIRNKNLLIFT